MTSAILIIVILGALDAMLYIACVELEKEKKNERGNRKTDR
jgi:hypothetical protein